MIWPYPTTTIASGTSARSFSAISGSRIRSGWWTDNPRRSAASFTGGMLSFCPRPLGRSGCVNTAATSCPDSTIRSSVGTANRGVPMKTSLIPAPGLWPLFSSPLVCFLQFPHLPPDQVSLQRADVADVQRPIQVIRFMQERPRQQILARHLERLSRSVECAHRYFLGPRHRLPERRQAQTALFGALRSLLADDLRIDQH